MPSEASAKEDGEGGPVQTAQRRAAADENTDHPGNGSRAFECQAGPPLQRLEGP